MSKIRSVENDPSMFLFWCPACDSPHSITTKIWTFNNDFEKPTIRNSILVHESKDADGNYFRHRCHSFVTDGQIAYEKDCSHAMAGQTVELPDYPQSGQ